MCFGGGGTNENDVAIKRQEQQATQEKRAAEEAARKRKEAEEAAKKREWQRGLNTTYNSAVGDAMSYFESMGIDPNSYQDDIAAAARRAKSSVGEGSTDIMSYFEGLGQQVYDQQTEAQRNRYLRDLNSFGRDGFARELIADTADDPIVEAILAEQRNSAEENLNTLLARDILSNTGYEAALGDLDKQSYGARSAIEELTASLLEGGRSDLRNVVSRGRSTANSLDLGEEFDPFSYQQQINDEAAKFFEGLGEAARGSLTSDVFDTSSAYNKGAFKQGAQNNPWSLAASMGAFGAVEDEEDKDDDKKKLDDFFAAF